MYYRVMEKVSFDASVFMSEKQPGGLLPTYGRQIAFCFPRHCRSGGAGEQIFTFYVKNCR